MQHRTRPCCHCPSLLHTPLEYSGTVVQSTTTCLFYLYLGFGIARRLACSPCVHDMAWAGYYIWRCSWSCFCDIRVIYSLMT